MKPAAGRPYTAGVSDDREAPVAARLGELGIPFERHEHPPVATVEEAGRYWARIDAAHCKNLFLRNQKGTRHYLVIVQHRKRVDLRAIAEQIGEVILCNSVAVPGANEARTCVS